MVLKGHIVTEATRRKISLKNRGRVQSHEERAARSVAAKAVYVRDSVARNNLKGRPWSEKRRREWSERMTGRTLSLETRKRLSESHKGKSLSAEARMKLSEANKGKVISALHREKISIANRRRWKEMTDEKYLIMCRKFSEGQTGKAHGEEYKRKMSEVKAQEVVDGVGRKQECCYNGLCFRSENEVRVAKWMDVRGYVWEYEPEKFLLENGRHYVPDFKIVSDEGVEWWEVKNRFTVRDVVKVTLFSRKHVLKIIDADVLCGGRS